MDEDVAERKSFYGDHQLHFGAILVKLMKLFFFDLLKYPVANEAETFIGTISNIRGQIRLKESAIDYRGR